LRREIARRKKTVVIDDAIIELGPGAMKRVIPFINREGILDRNTEPHYKDANPV
jgi:hypothetical protein